MTRSTFAVVLALLPLPAAAAAQSIIGLSQTIQNTIYKPLTYVIIGYALLLFVWGIYKYIAQSGDERGAEEGTKLMSYGILVLFVMTAMWGLVRLGLAFFGFEGGQEAKPQGSVFGLSTTGSYTSSQVYSPTDYDYSYTYDYR